MVFAFDKHLKDLKGTVFVPQVSMLIVMPRSADPGNSRRQEGNCCHFTIRGYAADVRKSERNLSWPFDSFNNCDHKDNNEDLLPPITFAEFRWWNCANCLQVTETDCTLQNGTNLKGPCTDKIKAVSYANLPSILTSEESDGDRPVVPVENYKFCSPSGCCKIKDLVRHAAPKVCETHKEGFKSIQEDQTVAVALSACDDISCKQHLSKKPSKINITEFLCGLKRKDSFPESLAVGVSDGRTVMLHENDDNVPKKLVSPDAMGCYSDAFEESEDPPLITNNTNRSFNTKDHNLPSNHLHSVGKLDHINKESSSKPNLCSLRDDNASIVYNLFPEIISTKVDTQNVGKPRNVNHLSEGEENTFLTASSIASEKPRKKSQKKRMLSDIFRSEVAGVSQNTDSLQVEFASAVCDDICSSPEILEEHNSALRAKQSSEINTKGRSSVSEVDDDESSLMSWFNRMPKKARAVKSDKETKNAFTKQYKKPVLAAKGKNLKNQSNAFFQETVAEVTKGKDNGKKNNNKNQALHISVQKKHHGRKMKKSASSQKHDTMGKKSKEQNQIDHIEMEQGLAQINHSNDSLLQFINEVEHNAVNLTNSHTASLSSLLAETERNISSRHEVLDGPNGCNIADGLENYYSQVGKITYKQIFGSKDNDDICCQSNYKKEIWHSVNQKGGSSQDGIPTEILKFLQNKQQKQNSFENSTETLMRTSEAQTETILNYASFGEEGALAGVSKILMEQNPQLGAIDFVGEISGTSNKDRLWQSSQCRSSGSDCGDEPCKEKGLSNLNWTVCHINGQERIERDESQLLQISEKLQELSVMELGKMSIHSDGETSSPWKHISSQNDSRVRKRSKAFKYETELLHASKRLQTLSLLQPDESSDKSSNDMDRGHYPKNHLGRLHFKQPCGRFAGTVPSSGVEELRFCQSFSLYPSRFCKTRGQRSQDIPLTISRVEMLSSDALIKRKRAVDSGRGVTNSNETAQLPNRKQTVDFRHVNESCLESQEPRLMTNSEYNSTVICPLNFRSNEPMSAMNLLKLMDPAVCSNQNLFASRENSHRKLLPCSSFSNNHPYGGSVLGCQRSDLEKGYKQLPTNTAGGREFFTANPANTYTAALKMGVPAQLFVKENPYHNNFRMIPFMTRQPFPVQDNNICYGTTPYSFIWTDRTGANTSSHGSHGNKRRIPCFQPGAYGQSRLPRILEHPLPTRTEPALAIAHNTNMAFSVQKNRAEDIKLQKSSIEREFCVLNMNPADFTLPDENTDFMIRHGELGCRSWLQAKRRRQLITFSFWQQQRAMNLAVQNSLV